MASTPPVTAEANAPLDVAEMGEVPGPTTPKAAAACVDEGPPCAYRLLLGRPSMFDVLRGFSTDIRKIRVCTVGVGREPELVFLIVLNVY